MAFDYLSQYGDAKRWDRNPIPAGLDPRGLADYIYQAMRNDTLPSINEGEGWEKSKAGGFLTIPGAQMYLPDFQTWRDYGLGGGSPDPELDMEQFARKNGLTLRQFQEQYGALPIRFDDPNSDYATYDPAARVNKFSYEPADSAFTKFLPAAIMALGGAGMAGMLPGTTSAFAGGLGGLAPTTAAEGAFPAFMGDVGGAGFGAGASAGAGAAGGLSPGNMQWLNNSLAGEAPAGGMNVMGAGGVDFAGSQVAGNPFAFTPDPSMQAMLQGPSVGSYGALDTALGTAAGGASGSIPGIQNILQTAGSGTSAAAPGILQRAAEWLRAPVIPGGSGDNGGNGGNGGGGLVNSNPLTWGQLLGTGLTTGLGYLSAEKQADRSQAAVDRALGITEQELAARRPFSQTATNWLQNPNQFWQSDPMQEIARQTARVIGGARKENLYDNPTGQSLVMQSLAPTWLNAVTQMANLGLQNTAPLANVTGNLGLAAAQAQGMPGAVLGAGAADLFNPGGIGMQNTNNVLRSLMMQQGGGGTRLG